MVTVQVVRDEDGDNYRNAPEFSICGRPVNTEGPAQSDGGRWQGERIFRRGPTGK